MRKILLQLSMALCAVVLLYGCSKDGPGGGPDPDPSPGEEDGLLFPKKEMRAVWITTAWQLDWPQQVYNVEAQKQKYRDMLDRFKELKFNTVFVQIRSMGDAFYASPYEPWSGNITGTRGQNPGYDVLQFMIEEAHARDLEFHAWINPYRISTRASASDSYPALHPSIDPSWVVDHGGIRIYNPAIPEVRIRLSDIVKDIITKYDIDGIHFDDYFYPDPSSAGTMVSDQADYVQYGAGYSTIQQFRRANVDKAIQAIYQTIVDNKPQVVFSISPAANKDYNYNTLYADLAKWCQEGWVDILIPQLYQEIGNTVNDFQVNLAIWAQFSYSAKLVVGHGYYKFGASGNPAAFQSTAELERQFDLAKRNAKVVGSAMYSARDVLANRIGITDKLAELYSKVGVIPFAGREVAPPPAVAGSVSIAGNQLSWTTNGNVRSVVYYFPTLTDQGEVVTITTGNSVEVTRAGHYCIRTLNVDNLESKASAVVEKN